MKILFTLLCVAVAVTGSGQTLFSSSEQAGPGAAISVVGDALTPSTRFTFTPYVRVGSPGTPITVAPLQANGSVAIVTIPASFPTGVYKLTAANAKVPSNALHINRPRLQWTDVDEARPGQAVRLVGRNLRPFGTTTEIWLTNVATRKTFPASPVFASDTAVKFTIPGAASPGLYRIALRNGLAGTVSAAPVTLPLTVRPAAGDPFELGVAWGGGLSSEIYDAKKDRRLPAHPAGDGRTEDGASITACLDYVAAHGGGVLRLPEGTYRVDKGDNWLVVRSGTVLRGAGKGKTILQLGYVPTPDYHCPLTFAGGNVKPEGIMDLTVQNLNTAGAPNRLLNTYFGDPTQLFLKRVEFRLGNAHEINVSRVRGIVIDRCEFNSPSMGFGTLALIGDSEVRFTNNVEYHRAARLVCSYGNRIVLEGNTIHFDNAYRNASSAETGGIELSFSQRTLLLNNEIGALGRQPASRAAGDGEVVITQYAQTGDFLFSGRVKRVEGTRLTPSETFPTTAWQDARFPYPSVRMAVLVVAGRGTGQWRRATSWTANSVTVDSPWQVPPNASSRYVVMPLNCYQHTYQSNLIFGGFYGIEWEDGAMDSTASGNTLRDTGFLGLTAYVADARNGQWGANGSNHSFTAGWNNSILRNTLLNTNGLRRATLSLAALDTLDLNLGPLLLGTDVRYNTIVGRNMPPITAQVGQTDGLEVIAITPNHAFHVSDVLQQGTVLQDNAISKTDYPVRNFMVAGGFLSNAPSSPTIKNKGAP